MKKVDFDRLPFDAGDKIWVMYKGQLYEAEVYTVSIRAGEEPNVIYHANIPSIKVFGSRNKYAKVDIELKDVNLLAWKTKEEAEKAINSVTFTVTSTNEHSK